MDKESEPPEAIYVHEDGLSGMAFIKGENWRFKSQKKVKKGDKLKILRYQNLILRVEPLEKNKKP